MTTSRIEALADGVFAIAMTLLVLELHIPHLAEPVTTAGLWRALVALAPGLAGYAVSFIILGTLWVGLHNQFHFILRADRLLLWINICYLMCVAFLPFATALLAAYNDQPVAAAVYGGTLLLAGLLLYANWTYATAGRRLVDQALDEAVVRAARRRVAAGFLVYGAATLVALWQTQVGLVLFALMPLAYILPGRVDRHLGR